MPILWMWECLWFDLSRTPSLVAGFSMATMRGFHFFWGLSESSMRMQLMGSSDGQVQERHRRAAMWSRERTPGASSHFSCRVYRTETGVAGRPEDWWIRDALTRSGP